MSRPPTDLSLFVEDVRVSVRNEGGTFSMSAFPADTRTKDWIAARQKEAATTRSIGRAPSELQWRSLGLLEFMEVDGEIFIVKPRKKQIIFNLSMLIPDHVDALQAKIERKHNIRLTQEQIQPLSLAGFQAFIEIKEDDMKRVFTGYVKNLDAVRPLQCVFDFASVYDMELVMEELNSEDGVTMSCLVSVGEIRFEKTALAIPKQRLVDAKIAEAAFGDNMDYALFSTSQLNELAQLLVNTIVISELNTLGGSLIDAKPMVLTALQAIPVEFTPDYAEKISPLNGEKTDILYEMGIDMDAAPVADGPNPVINTISPRTLMHSPEHIAAGKVSSAAGINLERKRGAKDAGDVKMAHKVASPSFLPSRGAGTRVSFIRDGTRKMYRVQRSKLYENITLNWFKTVNSQLAIFPPIEIDTKTNVCSYTDKSYRDLPRCVTSVTVIRLPSSAWVTFKPPSDSGGSPIESYTVYAEPLIADPGEDERGGAWGHETAEQKYARRAKAMASGTSSPINVGPLRPDIQYRFSVECFNATGASRISEPILSTVTDNDFYATIPLYGIILYSGPREGIPDNYRKLDGTEPGIPNLYGAFNMKTDMSGVPAASPAASTGIEKVPWYGGLCYIQRIY